MGNWFKDHDHYVYLSATVLWLLFGAVAISRTLAGY